MDLRYHYNIDLFHLKYEPQMKKTEITIKLQLQLMKEGETAVWHCPALDICGYGSTPEEAKKDFDVALKIFLSETATHKTLDKALEELGWKKITVNNKPKWTPQIEILNSNIQQEVHLPVPA